MKDTVATASRNLLRITARKYAHYAYRGAQLVTGRGRDPDGPSVLLYPSVDDAMALGDLLNRLGWYLPERTLDPSVTVHLPTPLSVDPAHERVPDCQAAYDTGHLPLDVREPGETARLASEADQLFVWNARARLRPAALRNLPKVEIVDPEYYSGVESYTWGVASNRLRASPDSLATEAFEALEARAADCERSFVFATGPSLDDATDFEFREEDLTVVCNSIVRNRDLLEHIDPDVLVFADPVFHFGPSRYAARFREDAVDALRAFDCVGFVPERHRSLLAGHYPDVEVVGLESADVDEPLFPTPEDPRVMGTNNVMTWFMLPIAAGLTDEVYVLGADGREEGESYFWEHNEDAQYDDELMRAAVDCHPSFFRDRVYTDYYDEHVETLTAFIEHCEARDVAVHNLTHSYIDALAERRVAAVAR